MKNPKKLYSHSFKAQQTLLDYLLLPESENISTQYDKGISIAYVYISSIYKVK